MTTTNPTITIRGPLEARQINTRNGERTVYQQPAIFDAPTGARFAIDLELKHQRDEYAVGTVLEWDVAADIVQGRFGPELGRIRSLTRRAEAKPAARATA